MTFPNRKSLENITCICLALIVFILAMWAVSCLLQRPDAGANWSFATGQVTQIEIGGPSDGLLQLGDHVIFIDGLPVDQARGYPGRRIGDSLHLTVLRDGILRTVEIALRSPKPFMILDRLTPLWIGLAFWAMGVVVFALDRGPARKVFFVYGQAACATLATGSISFFGPDWSVRLFGLLMWWAGPIMVHVHLRMFHDHPHPKLARLPALLYLLSAVMSVAGTIARTWDLGISTTAVQTVEYAWLGFNFTLALLLTFRTGWRGAIQKKPRNRRGILALLTVLGISPMLALSLLPQVLFKRSLVPYEVSFLFFALLPIGYAMSILQGRLSRISRYVNRTAGSVIAVLAITVIYLLIYYIFLKIFQTNDRALILSGLLITLGLVAAFTPLRRMALSFTNVIFFGAEYDFQAAIQEIETSLLDAGSDPRSMGESLSQGLRRIMRVDNAGLLLLHGDRAVFIVNGETLSGPQIDSADQKAGATIDQIRSARQQPELREAMLDAAALFTDPGERLPRLVREAEIILPLQGSKERLAVLFLGRRQGFRGYEDADMDILKSITSQARTALENAFLLAEAQELSRLTARLNRQVMQAREDERKRVARDLHDHAIQSLVGLNFQMAGLRDRLPTADAAEVGQFQEMVRDLSQDLRRICSDLRPPALDTVGLIPTIQSRITELRRQPFPRVSFAAEGDETQDIPDDLAMCMYRVFQEAMLNVAKHSRATQVDVTLRITSDQVNLSILDDGRGFNQPEHIGQLAGAYHFGLVGMKEMLEALGGSLKIETEPGNGCLVTATAPLSQRTPSADSIVMKETAL